MLAIANGGQIPADEVDRLREQVLRNLIDETLEIQAAKTEKIDDQAVGHRPDDPARRRQRQADAGPARRLSSSPTDRTIKSLRRQIEGEIAWQRLQRAKIESSVTVGDDEVKAVIDKMNASKGTEEYRVGEIFLSATPATEAQTLDNANKILDAAASSGASFAGYARQYSEASTAAVGGDLGWVRPEQLPAPLADALRADAGRARSAIRSRSPGGFSIIAVQDTRKILTADPRDAMLSLKQVSIIFPKGTTRAAGRADGRPLRRGGARASAAAAAPTSSRPTSTPRSSAATRSRCATCRPPCSS